MFPSNPKTKQFKKKHAAKLFYSLALFLPRHCARCGRRRCGVLGNGAVVLPRRLGGSRVEQCGAMGRGTAGPYAAPSSVARHIRLRARAPSSTRPPPTLLQHLSLPLLPWRNPSILRDLGGRNKRGRERERNRLTRVCEWGKCLDGLSWVGVRKEIQSQSVAPWRVAPHSPSWSHPASVVACATH
jgi:hypothetical protein